MNLVGDHRIKISVVSGSRKAGQYFSTFRDVVFCKAEP
jgi:hypothetical protein